MLITKQWLEEKMALPNDIAWFCEQKESNGTEVLKKLFAEDRLDFAHWLIVRIMSHEQYVCYALFAAKTEIDSYLLASRSNYNVIRAIRAALYVMSHSISDNPNNNCAAEMIYSVLGYLEAYDFISRKKILEYGISLLTVSNKAH